jgi:hypothetical protein
MLVFFGATGDLAYKKIFPALQAMIKRGTLSILPVRTTWRKRGASSTPCSVRPRRFIPMSPAPGGPRKLRRSPPRRLGGSDREGSNLVNACLAGAAAVSPNETPPLPRAGASGGFVSLFSCLVRNLD